MESDGLRERREREFQRRVLAAIERPKSNRFWAFINSAAFLWLASAIVLTGGGWYITSYQDCAKSSDDVVEKLQNATSDFVSKLNYLLNFIAGPSVEAVPKINFQWPE
jgi:hypothetical protein